MRIQIKVRQIDLADMMDDLKEQMGEYGSKMVSGGVTCFMGDKFNVYLYPTEDTPALSHELRLLEILPKNAPVA